MVWTLNSVTGKNSVTGSREKMVACICAGLSGLDHPSSTLSRAHARGYSLPALRASICCRKRHNV
jgi:hypothetical protein